MKKILRKIYYFFRDKRIQIGIRRKSFYICFCGKCLHYISKKAKVLSADGTIFNHSVYSRNQNFEKGILKICEYSNVSFGKNVEFRSGCKLFVFQHATFSIGNNSFINTNSFIDCKEKIVIGDDCAISRNVVIMDNDTHEIEGTIVKKPIIIGNHVLIGTNVIVLKGVDIGDNCIIGAGSVVTHDIPSNYMAAGNPARIIKPVSEWKR